MHIRWMIRRDMPEVLQADRSSHCPAWSEEDFLCQLRQRNCLGFVAEDHNNMVCGFVVYNLHRHRLEVVRMCVDPKYRRQGVGRRLLGYLTSKLSTHRRTCVTVSYMRSDVSDAFLRRGGFEVVKSHHVFGMVRFRGVNEKAEEACANAKPAGDTIAS